MSAATTKPFSFAATDILTVFVPGAEQRSYTVSPSEHFSFPLWLVEYFINKWGKGDTLEFLRYSLTSPKLVVRRSHLTDAETLEKTFDDEGVRYSKLAISKDCYEIAPNRPLSDMQSFNDGLFIVQSVPSSLVVDLLAVTEGDTVYDLCSAPGTKTVKISVAAKEKGLVVAADIHLHRLLKVKENIERFKLKNVSLLLLSAKEPLPFKEGVLADNILLDVPCSGLGIVRKTPEIKYKICRDDIRALSENQYDILLNASKQLKKGGKMVYSTCSIIDEENADVVKKFLDNNSDYVLEEIKDPDLIKNDFIDENGCFRTLPHRHKTDGFFAAVIVREK
ncbi:RsmB/NOP family class I SAM-dependent RNA methyltransferase [Thermodesulfobacteriota bacterium]